MVMSNITIVPSMHRNFQLSSSPPSKYICPHSCRIRPRYWAALVRPKFVRVMQYVVLVNKTIYWKHVPWNARTVLLGEHVTDSFSCNAGVRQGDVSSTTLFNIYVNDLVNEITNLHMSVSLGDDLCVSIRIYADDIVLLAENEENLQCMINYLYNWCTNWRMSSNCDKTKIVGFRNKPQCPTSFFHVQGNI